VLAYFGSATLGKTKTFYRTGTTRYSSELFCLEIDVMKFVRRNIRHNDTEHNDILLTLNIMLLITMTFSYSQHNDTQHIDILDTLGIMTVSIMAFCIC
jgi:hypothetical protein